MKTSVLFFLVVTTIASCHYASPDPAYVPDHPGYDEDIHPLLSDHCLVCHGHPSNRGAPGYFRLDVYDDTDDVAGALRMFRDRGAMKTIETGQMPPAAKDGEGVGPKGVLILQRWIADGLPRKRP
jgi:hypothetical protein